MAYFPIFLQLEGKECLVVGGGAVAFRKVKALEEFGAKVSVVSPKIIREIQEIEGVVCECRSFDISDLKNKELVIAATNQTKENHKISLACRQRGILINAADQKEDCSFLFPAYIKQGDGVAAFSSGGKSPVAAQYMKDCMEPIMTKRLGEMIEYLGSIRNTIKKQIGSEAQRKELFQEILKIGLEEDRIPENWELNRMIHKYNRKSREEIWTERDD